MKILPAVSFRFAKLPVETMSEDMRVGIDIVFAAPTPDPDSDLK